MPCLFLGGIAYSHENILYSYELIKPQKGERWVLITSAFHMPRAVGVFRNNKWEVIPYPVDYKTYGPHDYGWHYDGFSEVRKVARGLREWLGLVVYWASGKTQKFFPGPHQ